MCILMSRFWTLPLLSNTQTNTFAERLCASCRKSQRTLNYWSLLSHRVVLVSNTAILMFERTLSSQYIQYTVLTNTSFLMPPNSSIRSLPRKTIHLANVMPSYFLLTVQCPVPFNMFSVYTNKFPASMSNYNLRFLRSSGLTANRSQQIDQGTSDWYLSYWLHLHIP